MNSLDRLIEAMLDEAERPGHASLLAWQRHAFLAHIALLRSQRGRLPDARSTGGLAPWQERMFKKSVGVPPHRYQLLLRLERAKELLVESEMSVLEIALAVGYDSPQTIARLFQRELGVTPSAYRRERKR